MGKVVIMFPDFQGKASTDKSPNGFVARLSRAMPEAVLVPVLNGLPEEELCFLRKEALLAGLSPIISTDQRGLLGTLVVGYQAVIQFATGPIVRLDTAEHPPEEIPRLLAEAEKGSCMVIGDLDFSKDDLLVNGSADDFAHRFLFPTLYRIVTKGKLELSCAHGFQVFSGAHECRAVLENALKIVTEVEREVGKTVTWGWDGLMALVAEMIGIPVRVVKVEAETKRNRKLEKIANQFEGALCMCLAVDRFRRSTMYVPGC